MCSAACNHWADKIKLLRSLVAMANGTRFEVIVAVDSFTDASQQLGRPSAALGATLARGSCCYCSSTPCWWVTTRSTG